LHTTRSNILVSYYEHGDSYAEHHDVCVVTCLFWFYKEPKQFSGGELFFPQFNKTFPPKNNSLLMFPSHAKHLVTPVQIEEKYRGKGFGRYCVSLFLMFPA
jgi:Rps23 Pro-64 3,4-dihydroxylase Tpa1-like proline 4-hydroxylase